MMAAPFALVVIVAALVAVVAAHVFFAALVGMVVWAVVNAVLTSLQNHCDRRR